MKNKKLADLWHSQQDQVVIDDDNLIQTLRQEHRHEERNLLWLNFQECIPALFLFSIFGLVGFFKEEGRWAFITASLLCLGVGLLLSGTTIRRRIRESFFGDSVKEELQKAVAQVKHRQWLYRNIFWWYLLPLILGWGAIVYEMGLKNGVSTFHIVYIAVAFVFFSWVYWINRRIAFKRYGPRRKLLEEMLRSIDYEG